MITAMNPYAMLVDFMIDQIKPEAISAFRASEEIHDYFYNLIEKEKAGTATPDEVQWLNDMMNVEHIMRLAKAKVKQHAHQ
jgi:predicted NACHT family NTPase